MLNLSFGIPERLDIRTFIRYLSIVELEDLEVLHKFIYQTNHQNIKPVLPK
jgi:hypothetical protein